MVQISNDFTPDMIRITAHDIPRSPTVQSFADGCLPNDDTTDADVDEVMGVVGSEVFASRIAQRRINHPNVGAVNRAVGCFVGRSAVMTWLCRPSFRKNQKRLASDPRLKHVLERLSISIIRKVEKIKPCGYSEEELNKSTKSLSITECPASDKQKPSPQDREPIKQKENCDVKVKEKLQDSCDDKENKVKKKKSTTETKALLQSKTKDIMEYHECPICWEPYKVSQQICFPANKKCNHVFHAECMVMWLMKNDHCPLCRCNYIRA